MEINQRGGGEGWTAAQSTPNNENEDCHYTINAGVGDRSRASSANADSVVVYLNPDPDPDRSSAFSDRVCICSDPGSCSGPIYGTSYPWPNSSINST